MKKVLIFCLLILGCAPLFAQADSSKRFTERNMENAKFQGDINKYLADSINYPKQAIDAKIQGTVYVTFIIEKDGSVSEVKILRGIPNGKMLDDETVRVISTMPKWIPSKVNGHPVRSAPFNMPIHFILPEKNEKSK